MHRDSIDRFEVQTLPTTPKLPASKRLGTYLLEAGLISEAQVAVALNDQQATGMKFGEVLATRGWVKQQTVEYVMQKIVIPERKARERKKQKMAQAAKVAKPPTAKVSTVRVVPTQSHSTHTQSHPTHNQSHPTHPQSSPAPNDSTFTRRDAPISKPLPSVPNPNDDVSWVG